VSGPRRDHIFAFARRLGERVAVVILPRLLSRLSAGTQFLPLGESIWQATQCAVPNIRLEGQLRNMLTGESIERETRDGTSSLRIASALAEFPVAVFM